MVKWLRRIGVAGFLFFLIKGLVWVAIFFYIKSCSQQQKAKAGNISRPSYIVTSYISRG